MERDLHSMNEMLIGEVNQYLSEHPSVIEQIPRGAVIVVQVTDDPEFNEWSERMAKANRELNQPLVYFKIRALAPPHSRILGAELTTSGVS